MIQRTGKFTVSVLSQSAQFELFKHFGFQSGRDMNKFETFEKCARGENGIYYITEGTNAYISVSVNKTEDLGSHTMFGLTLTYNGERGRQNKIVNYLFYPVHLFVLGMIKMYFGF